MGTLPTAFQMKPVRIVVVGAGISGIQFVHDATTRLPGVTVVAYDKNPDVGGTWYEKRYPGCACDVPSHTYQYSWSPNPSWSRLYAESPEILSYIQNTVQSHDLGRFFRFNQRCVGASWDESASKWKIQLENTEDPMDKHEDVCDFFVYAVGRLNNWQLPNIPGIEKLPHTIVHTAAWPKDLDVSNQRVAVIGNGASAVQCLARIAESVESVDNFIRSPTWLVPHVFSEDGEPQLHYPDDLVEKLKNDPRTYYDLRLKIEKQLASSFAGLWSGSLASQNFTSRAHKHMIQHIKDPSKLDALLPNFPAGCRRFTPADFYMKALNQDNVSLISSPISHATEKGFHTSDGKTHQGYDTIICATGFEPYAPRFDLRGENNRNLSDMWSAEGGYGSYMAATVAGFPNFFVFNPPVCPVNGSAYPGIERASDYMIRVIKRFQMDNIRSICVKDSAQQEFMNWVKSRMKDMVWSASCSSWYKSSSGSVIVPWPGTMLHYYEATEYVRWEHFDLEFSHEDTCFASFGNGITTEGVTSTPERLHLVHNCIRVTAARASFHRTVENLGNAAREPQAHEKVRIWSITTQEHLPMWLISGPTKT